MVGTGRRAGALSHCIDETNRVDKSLAGERGGALNGGTNFAQQLASVVRIYDILDAGG
jgi:hypothetical protein